MVQGEDNGSQMHDIVLDHCDSNHNFRSYRVKLPVSGRVIMRKVKHIKCTDITSCKYLRNVEQYRVYKLQSEMNHHKYNTQCGASDTLSNGMQVKQQFSGYQVALPISLNMQSKTSCLDDRVRYIPV